VLPDASPNLADEFERLAFEASLPALVDRLRAGDFGPVVVIWSEEDRGQHRPTHLRFPGEAAPVSLWDAYRTRRLR
jgi:hypothetical protein